MQASIENLPSGLPLEFEGVLVIVGGGVVDGALLLALKKRGAHIVAADSGAHACEAVNLVPDAIIGDLDSLRNRAEWTQRTQVFQLDEQESIDFEKCLYATHAKVTICLGMTGARFDHTLAALDVMARYACNRHLILVNEVDLALGVCGDFAFGVAPEERVSIHPLGVVNFAHSEGLEYPLDGLKLAPGVRTGTSNVAIDGGFEIFVKAEKQAPWLLLVEVGYLDDLVEVLMR